MFNDWDALKDDLLKGLSDQKKDVLGKVLDNQKDELNKSAAPGGIGDFKKIVLPMIRKIIPSTIAADIAGVQPMTGPAGQIFSIKPKYGNWWWTFEEWLHYTRGANSAKRILSDPFSDEYCESLEKFINAYHDEKLNDPKPAL